MVCSKDQWSTVYEESCSDTLYRTEVRFHWIACILFKVMDFHHWTNKSNQDDYYKSLTRECLTGKADIFSLGKYRSRIEDIHDLIGDRNNVAKLVNMACRRKNQSLFEKWKS